MRLVHNIWVITTSGCAVFLPGVLCPAAKNEGVPVNAEYEGESQGQGSGWVARGSTEGIFEFLARRKRNDCEAG
jgi:hypothetical protein